MAIKIRLGPAGNIDKGLLNSLEKVAKLNLNAQELEFVYNVNVKEEVAKEASVFAKEKDIVLSAHGSYFINLNSDDPEKIEASKKRILSACRMAHYFSSVRKAHIVFHAGFYGKKKHDETYEEIKKHIIELQKIILDEKLNCVLAPETTGKASQFGSIEELVQLSNETGCRICVDFAHIYARNIGVLDLDYVFNEIHKLKYMKKDPYLHCHFTGIEYTDKGEKRHKNLTEEFFLPLAKRIKKENIEFCIISESPITYKDSLLMKKVLDKL